MVRMVVTSVTTAASVTATSVTAASVTAPMAVMVLMEVMAPTATVCLGGTLFLCFACRVLGFRELLWFPHLVGLLKFDLVFPLPVGEVCFVCMYVGGCSRHIKVDVSTVLSCSSL